MSAPKLLVQLYRADWPMGARTANVAVVVEPLTMGHGRAEHCELGYDGYARFYRRTPSSNQEPCGYEAYFRVESGAEVLLMIDGVWWHYDRAQPVVRDGVWCVEHTLTTRSTLATRLNMQLPDAKTAGAPENAPAVTTQQPRGEN